LGASLLRSRLPVEFEVGLPRAFMAMGLEILVAMTARASGSVAVDAVLPAPVV